MKLTESLIERLSDLLNAAAKLVKQVCLLLIVLAGLLIVTATTYWVLYDKLPNIWSS